jgi:hypothetical protein
MGSNETGALREEWAPLSLEKSPLSSELAPLSFSLKVTLSQWGSLLSLVVAVNFFLLKRRHASSKELASSSWSTDIKKINKT